MISNGPEENLCLSVQSVGDKRIIRESMELKNLLDAWRYQRKNISLHKIGGGSA